MLCPDMKYHSRKSSIMSVVNIMEVKRTAYGYQVRYTFPQILVWSGDGFGYVDELRMEDVMTCVTEYEAKEKIRLKLETIFSWEHRKTCDPITPVIPLDC